MNLLQSRLLVVVTAFLFCQCSERDPMVSEEESAASHEDPVALDGEAQAIDSGRVEILTVERKFTRRSREDNTNLEVRAAIPQFFGAGPGIERINGFLRHLVLNWPELVHVRDWEDERPVEPMRRLAAKLAALGPEDWPLLTEIHDAPLLTEHLIELSEVPFQEMAIFEVTILQFAGTEVTLHFESIGVAATSHSSVGELTIDLTTGRAVRVP